MNVGAVSVLAGGGGTLLGGIIVNKFSLKEQKGLKHIQYTLMEINKDFCYNIASKRKCRNLKISVFNILRF